jgi:predicted transcriptional regulator
MISREEILKLETRRKIYKIILENPGLHLREILRRTKLSYGVLSYHLKYLKKTRPNCYKN